MTRCPWGNRHSRKRIEENHQRIEAERRKIAAFSEADREKALTIVGEILDKAGALEEVLRDPT